MTEQSRREIRCRLECREDDTRTGPGRIVGTIIEAGRVAGDRPEVFTPGALRWPSNGIRLLAEHRGRQVLRFQPREDGTRLVIDERLPDTPIGREVAAEIRSGRKRGLSVEFFSADEARVQGVREIRSALVDAAAIVQEGAYDQARAEVRQRNEVFTWL